MFVPNERVQMEMAAAKTARELQRTTSIGSAASNTQPAVSSAAAHDNVDGVSFKFIQLLLSSTSIFPQE